MTTAHIRLFISIQLMTLEIKKKDFVAIIANLTLMECAYSRALYQRQMELAALRRIQKRNYHG
jgi:hypothetical protein